MPNAAIDLTTLAIVKDHLGISNTSQDTRLDRLITAASEQIERFCDRKFIEVVGHVEYHNGRRSNTLLLKQWPAQKPTEVNIDNGHEFGTSTQVETTDYEVQNDSLLILFNGRSFQRGNHNVKIVYTYGYQFADLPESLQHMANMQVEYLYNLTTKQRLGMQSKSKQGESTTYNTAGLPPQVRDGLMPFKRPYEWGSNASIDNY